MLAVAELHPHPSNVREDLGDLTELAASLRAVGQLMPLLVRPRPRSDGFVVQDGNRRLGALNLAGIQRALCLVREDTDGAEDLTLMVASAMHKQLTPLELANAFCALRNRGMGAGAISRATGYSTRTVGARLLLLDLPVEAQEMVAERRLTLAEAEDLARQLKVTTKATTRASSPAKASWLSKTHRLAAAVRLRCGHAGTRVLIGGVGCGQCWEQVIGEAAVATAHQEAA
jgi:ParB/RepB/Spo0J family partition protein